MVKSRKSTSEAPSGVTVFLAGLLAWIVPGAGHVYLGRTLRGVILCVCINGLFWTGVLIGGVFTVEPMQHRWWFAGQMCTGASGLAGWYRQRHVRRNIITDLRRDGIDAGQSRKAYTQVLIEKGLSLDFPAASVARAYSGVAGMLNIMVVFDAVMLAAMGRLGEPPPPKRGDEEKQA